MFDKSQSYSLSALFTFSFAYQSHTIHLSIISFCLSSFSSFSKSSREKLSLSSIIIFLAVLGHIQGIFLKNCRSHCDIA